MEFDYVIDLTQCKIPEKLIFDAVGKAQARIGESKFVGQMVNSETDSHTLNLAEITHYTSFMEYKRRKLRVKINTFNIARSNAVVPILENDIMHPVIVGDGRMNAFTGQLDLWRIKSIGITMLPTFPCQKFEDRLWCNEHFEEQGDLFTL
jgi:hypothetical protein